MKELKMIMDELGIYSAENSNVHFLANTGYNGGDQLEIAQLTAGSSYILRVKANEGYADCNVQYYTFETTKLLVDFLEKYYVY